MNTKNTFPLDIFKDFHQSKSLYKGYMFKIKQ